MISEERLRQAANEAGRALSESLPDPKDCQHTFSPEFERKMERLLRRSRYRGLRRGLQRAACFFLALLCTGGVWLTVDAEAREAFFGWARAQVEEAQRYFYQGDAFSADVAVEYTIQVPEAYEITDCISVEGYTEEYYVNTTGEYILFSYQYVTESSGGELYVGDTETECISVAVNGADADLYLPYDESDSTTVVWTDTETGVLIQVTAYMSQEDLIKLAETVAPEKT